MAKSFKQVAELDPDNVLIVDSLNKAFRWKHSGDLDFLDEYIKTIESYRNSYKCGKVIIACDQGSSRYRKALDPNYKANREELKANQSEEERLAFELFFKEFNRVMEFYRDHSKFPLFRFPKVEADDIASYIVKKYPTKKITLISSDRDWDLLINDNVTRFSYVTRKTTSMDTWLDHYDCLPEQYISIKCLQGDSGDNVPGVPGIGPVKAKGLIDKYGSALDIASALPISSKYKYIQNLNAFGAERIMLNYQLMDLVEFCEEAIGPENCAVIDAVLKEYLDGN